MLKEDTVAPDFTARTSDGTIFRLSSLRGLKHVALFFYPKDFSVACTRQACQFRDNYEILAGLNCEVIGISYDPPERHETFKMVYRLPYALISDTDKSIARLYDVMRFGGYLSFLKRATYVIDIGGMIRSAIHREFTVANHIETVKRVLAALEKERNH